MFGLNALKGLAKRPPRSIINIGSAVQQQPIHLMAAAAATPTPNFHHYQTPMMQMQISRGMVYSATPPLSMSLDEFRDPISRQERMSENVGRSWSAKELRRKSFDDLHKLWLVLYKERNMLLTEQQLSRRRQIIFPQPERLRKVRKSMGAIRQVLGERKRERLRQRLVDIEEIEEAGAGKDNSKNENDATAETLAKTTSAEA